MRDRTPEFAAVVESVRARQSPLAAAAVSAASSRVGRPRPHNPRSEFARAAAAIGHEINLTAGKLEKLTKLVKKKSLFDDRPVEIQELTYIVKQDLAALNQSIERLRQLMLHQKGQSKSARQADDHSNNVVVSLQSKLANTSAAFKDVLEMRTQNMKSQKDRREQFSAGVTGAVPATKPSPNSALYRRPSDKGSGVASTDHVTIDFGASTSSSSLLRQEMILAPQQEAYSESRIEEIHTIESTISQLGTIFQQLASLVAEQGEQIQRIDANVEEVEQNVDAAQKQLLQYLQTIGSNRALMLKVFGVVILFFVVFVVFFA